MCETCNGNKGNKVNGLTSQEIINKCNERKKEIIIYNKFIIPVIKKIRGSSNPNEEMRHKINLLKDYLTDNLIDMVKKMNNHHYLNNEIKYEYSFNKLQSIVFQKCFKEDIFPNESDSDIESKQFKEWKCLKNYQNILFEQIENLMQITSITSY